MERRFDTVIQTKSTTSSSKYAMAFR